MQLRKGDFVITPNGAWHDHGVESDGEICVWQDGLDLLFVNQLEANFYEVHPEIRQRPSYPTDDSPRLFGGPGLMPVAPRWSKPYSPLFRYAWDETYDALYRMASVSEGSACDGVMMRYVNPATGGSVMKTLGASIQLLRPGEQTCAHRHTGSFVYNVAKGAGFSIIEGKRFDWRENDIFVVPSWAMHEHANASSSEDAVLFSFDDLPVIEALDLYREEVLSANGGHQRLCESRPR